MLLQGLWQNFLFHEFLVNPNNQDVWLNKQQENLVYNVKTQDSTVQIDERLLPIKSGVQI